MPRKFKIGRAELELLQYIQDHHPLTVRQVAEQFGEGKGWVRTTVQNVMERLRKKGHLSRRLAEGVYQYAPCLPKPQLLRGLVREFVEHSLGGSLSPFVAYLSEEADLTDSDVAELREMVRELRSPKP